MNSGHAFRAAAIVLVFGLGACQSLETVQFQSSPPGAAVALSNGLSCAATPCGIQVARKEPFTATISKPGFRSTDVSVTTGYGDRGRTIMALNVLGGGIGGALGTEMSGQGYEHSPNPVVVDLKPVGPAARTSGPRRKTGDGTSASPGS